MGVVPPLWAPSAFETRMEYVRWVIVSELIRIKREGEDEHGNGVNPGATTGELTRALLREDGALTGSLRDNREAWMSERTPQRIEVRAALTTLLLDGLVRNPATTHLDVWHLTKTPARGGAPGRAGENGSLTISWEEG